MEISNQNPYLLRLFWSLFQYVHAQNHEDSLRPYPTESVLSNHTYVKKIWKKSNPTVSSLDKAGDTANNQNLSVFQMIGCNDWRSDFTTNEKIPEEIKEKLYSSNMSLGYKSFDNLEEVLKKEIDIIVNRRKFEIIDTFNQKRNGYDSANKSKNESFYNPINKEQSIEIENPFSLYNNYLSSFYTSKVLGEEDLTLQDLYIEPKISQNTSFYSFVGENLIEKTIQWLFNTTSFEEASNISYPKTRVILGYAGQGKTSFCYRLLYSLIVEKETKRVVLFFRLRNIDVSSLQEFAKNPLKVVFDELQKKGFQINGDRASKLNISEELFTDSILILDGLDEISEFYHQYDKNYFCEKLASSSQEFLSPYRLIITSRKEIDTYKMIDKGIVCWPISELSFEEQTQWIQNYNSKKNVQDKYIINQEALIELNSQIATQPLVRQPILLFILAKLKLSDFKNINSAKVYHILFDSLIKRTWINKAFERNGHPALIDKIQIRELLRNIGMEMLKKDKAILKSTELQNIFRRLGIDSTNLDIKEFRQLLLAFYFQETNQRENSKYYVFEFLHKTFGEYLAAEYIFEQMIEVFVKQCFKDEKFYHTDNKRKIRLLSRLFGENPTFLRPIIVNYIIDLINYTYSEIDKNIIEKLYFSMKESLSDMTLYDFFIPQLEDNHHVIEHSYKNFYGFFSIFNRCQKNLGSPIESNLYLGLLTLRLGGLQLTNNLNTVKNSFIFNLRNSYLSYSKFNYVNLDGFDFSNSSMESIEWTSVSLKETVWNNVDMKDGELKKVNMSQRDFEEFTTVISSNLENVKFLGSNLKNVQFSSSNLTNVKFENSKLVGVKFIRCNLTNASFFNSDLSFANFSFSEGLTVDQLSKAKSLHDSKGLPSEIESTLRKSYSHLFKN
jgi:hypothetical protein